MDNQLISYYLLTLTCHIQKLNLQLTDYTRDFMEILIFQLLNCNFCNKIYQILRRPTVQYIKRNIILCKNTHLSTLILTLVLIHVQFLYLQKFPDLKFKYVEEDQPEEFFIPYVWSLVCHSSNLFFNPNRIQLFTLQAEESPS